MKECYSRVAAVSAQSADSDIVQVRGDPGLLQLRVLPGNLSGAYISLIVCTSKEEKQVGGLPCRNHRSGKSEENNIRLRQLAARGCLPAGAQNKKNVIPEMTETKNTFRILFYIKRNALLRNGSAPIMGRITINGERTQFSTRLAVDPLHWDARSGRVLGRRAPAERINEQLNRIRMRLEQCYNVLLDCAQRLTPNAVKSLYFGREQYGERLLGFFHHHNEEFGRMVGINRSKATYNKYRCVCGHLENYIRGRYGRDDLEFGELDREFLYGFHRHIAQERGCSKNTIWIYMIALKHILTQARSRGYLKTDLFAGYKLRSERVSRNYLSIEEIQRLIRLELSAPTQRLVRDSFLFGCFTGLSYVDIRQLTPLNIHHLDRQTWIRTSRSKTASEVNVRLFPVAETILSRYMPAPDGGRIFDLPSNGWCNACLQVILRQADIRRRITFHCARHTFATTITLSQGVAIETICKLLGHKNIRTTQIYATLTHAKLASDMERLSERLEKQFVL